MSAYSRQLKEENEQLRRELQQLHSQISDESDVAADVDALRDLRAIVRALMVAVPASSRPGVYFLIDEEGEVIYVGQSQNVATRLGGHSGKFFADVRMLVIPSEIQRLKYERLLIRVLRPKFNVVHNPDRSQQSVGEIFASQ